MIFRRIETKIAEASLKLVVSIRTRSTLVLLDQRALLSILQYHLRRITPTCTADAASRMDTAAAQIQSVYRRFVICPARDGTHEQELVEHDLSVVEIAFGEGVGGFEIAWCESVTSDE